MTLDDWTDWMYPLMKVCGWLLASESLFALFCVLVHLFESAYPSQGIRVMACVRILVCTLLRLDIVVRICVSLSRYLSEGLRPNPCFHFFASKSVYLFWNDLSDCLCPRPYLLLLRLSLVCILVWNLCAPTLTKVIACFQHIYLHLSLYFLAQLRLPQYEGVWLCVFSLLHLHVKSTTRQLCLLQHEGVWLCAFSLLHHHFK